MITVLWLWAQVLINNAGVGGKVAPVEETDVDDVRPTLYPHPTCTSR